MESRTTPGSSEYTDFDGMEPGVCNENLRNNGYRISPKGGNGSKIHRMAKDDSPAAQSSASWAVQGGLGVHLCLRGLQSGAHPEPVSSTGVVQGRRVPVGRTKCLQASEQRNKQPSFPSLDDVRRGFKRNHWLFQQPASLANSYCSCLV